MRVIFFGTPNFAARTLEVLINSGIEIVGVVTRVDKPRGRNLQLSSPPVKEKAEDLLPHIPRYQPLKLSTPEGESWLKALKPDIFVVVAYGEIIKDFILNIAPHGGINLHASLLPKYRGAAPIQRAIINGESESGVSIMQMVKELDAGPVFLKKSIPIKEEMTCEDLEKALCELGSTMLVEVLNRIEEGTIKSQVQDHSKATYAPKIELEQGEINWNDPASKIHDLIRGMYPRPGAWVWVKAMGQTKRCKILKSRYLDQTLLPAQTFELKDKRMFIGCGQGTLEVLELQLEGKKPLTPDELLRGTNLSLG